MTDDEVRKLVSHNLRRLRGKLSLSELGRRCQTSAGAIRNMEHGRLPSLAVTARLAAALDVEIHEFLRPPKKYRKRR